MRDRIVDELTLLHEKSGLPVAWLLSRAEVGKGRFYDWKRRYGKINEHNGKVPRDHWLTSEEIELIIQWFQQHPFDGYRRCCYMMMDADIVAVSPASVYRVLSNAGLLNNRAVKPSKKGTGFDQPLNHGRLPCRIIRPAYLYNTKMALIVYGWMKRFSLLCVMRVVSLTDHLFIIVKISVADFGEFSS